MALDTQERKARRVAGMERAKADSSTKGKVQRIHRALTTGRPPASEMKSPTAAIGAARVLHSDLERKMKDEGLDPAAVKHRVAIAYVSPDLTAYGYTYQEAQEEILSELEGRVPIGLLFGVCDPADNKAIVGSRPFLNTKQTEEWLAELRLAFPVDVEDPV